MAFAKKVEAPKPPVVKTDSDVPKCECGEPCAPGQNQVCAKHIRAS